MTSTRQIHIVTFDPLGEQGGVGGFDWFTVREDAEQRYDEYVRQNAEGAPDRVRLWTAHPPATCLNEEITDYVETEFVENDPEGHPDRDTHPPRYGWHGWAAETENENDDDREGVYYLTITDDGEEMAVIVHRLVGGKFPLDGDVANGKVADAERIVAALNAYKETT